MAKLTKEELIKKISEKVSDAEVQVELMEDITDSFGEEVDNSELAELKVKYEELMNKYRDRFLEVKEVKEEIEDAQSESEDSEEMKEEEVIDIQDI